MDTNYDGFGYDLFSDALLHGELTWVAPFQAWCDKQTSPMISGIMTMRSCGLLKELTPTAEQNHWHT